MRTSFAVWSGRGRKAVVVERTVQDKRYELSGRMRKRIVRRRRWTRREDLVVVRVCFRRERGRSIWCCGRGL